MRFLFEEFPYNPDFLEKAIGYGKGVSHTQSESGFNTNYADGKVKIKGVGYCFYDDHSNGHPEGHPVFVLPKVFVYTDENKVKAFGEEIKSDGSDVFGNIELNDKNFRKRLHFFSSLSVWLYSAIDRYYKKQKDGEAKGVIKPPRSEVQIFKKADRYATLLDIISSMQLFYKKNQSLFVFVAKNKHSGNHKINWQRTVNKTMPFMQDGVPIYMNPINKAKVFDLDDRLLVLYFSAMRFIQEKFGYPMPQSEFYQPLRMNEMERLLENELGLRELKKIKYKYFEDRLVKLYNIMEAFFSWGARYCSKISKSQEYLIANSFNNVFEAMIDELIGDPEYADLKKNDDGKIIDHLYREKSLIFPSDNNDDIWHIGDSKYYKDPEDIKGTSIAKQYTYAKNMMQMSFNSLYMTDFGPRRRFQGICYRDDNLTKGYNVTPNFFIRGDIPKFEDESQFSSDYFYKPNDEIKLIRLARKDNENGPEAEQALVEYLWKIRQRQFENRLFDRDTLLLQIYDVNFLYVLKAYTSKQSSLREKFKRDARAMFRKNFLDLLDAKFYFWAIYMPDLEGAEGGFDDERRFKEFVISEFYYLEGKIFQPNGLKKCIILALERESVDNRRSDYQKVRQVVDDAGCEVYKVHPNDNWDGVDMNNYLRTLRPDWEIPEE